jgi:hypothetical protein
MDIAFISIALMPKKAQLQLRSHVITLNTYTSFSVAQVRGKPVK